MNYSELTAAIEGYVENTFDSSTMATIVRQAEQRIYNSAQPAFLRKNVTGYLSTGSKYLSCPTDFLSVYSLAVVDTNGDYVYLLDKDVNYIREMYPTPSYTALPKYYAIFGPKVETTVIFPELSFIVGPTPDLPYELELHYNYYPESIVTASTTWLGNNFDTVLLYGSIVEAYTYLKGEQDLLVAYDAKYKEALGLYKQLGDGKQRGDTFREGQISYPVK